MTENWLQKLLDEREIEGSLIRIARAMDDRDWSAIAGILADDALGDFGEGRLEGSAAIIDTLRKYLDRCGTTQHLLGNIVIDVSGDQATTRTYVHDIHCSFVEESQDTFFTLGDYHDRWERKAESWKLIERVKLNRKLIGSRDVFDIPT